VENSGKLYIVEIAEPEKDEGYGAALSIVRKGRPELADAIADALIATDRTRLMQILAQAVMAVNERSPSETSPVAVGGHGAEIMERFIMAAVEVEEFWHKHDADMLNSPSHSAPAH